MTVAIAVNRPSKCLILLGGGARRTQNQRWSRERYQAVAQRPELAHFELVHIAPFDPAVLVGPRRLPTVPEPRNSPGVESHETMHARCIAYQTGLGSGLTT